MGYYIETPAVHGKTAYLRDTYDAEIITVPASYQDIPDGKAAVVVVDNGIFEAAGFAYSENEFNVFTAVHDSRPKTWLLMDRITVELLSGYHRPPGSFPDYTVKNPAEIKKLAEQLKAAN